MRIAIVSGMPPNKEGEAHYASRVYGTLAQQVNVPILVCSHWQSGALAIETPSPQYTIRRVTYGYHRFKRHFASLYLIRALRTFQPDIVHFQAPHKKLYGGIYGEPLLHLFCWLRRRGIPSVVTLHSLWLREDFVQMAQERQRPASVRAILEQLHQHYFRRLLGTATQVNALVAGDLNPLIGEFQKEWNLERFSIQPEVHPCEVFTLSPSDIVMAKRALGLENKRLVFAFGFVRPDKGFHYLIEAFAPLAECDSDLLLLIAGEPKGVVDTRYAQQLKEQQSALRKSSQVRLLFGYLPDEQMHAYLRACDVLVLPYTRVMGASGPMHHALSYGKPVIATAVGQNRGLADVCILVPPRHPEALRNALQSILYESGRWEFYHQKAVLYATEHTWHHLAQRYYHDYEKLVGGGMS